MRRFIRLRCVGCGARIKAPLELLGYTRPCPGCGRHLTIQPRSPEDAAPVLLLDGDPPSPVIRRRG
jgi:rRNA maturation endonuclease Nob1